MRGSENIFPLTMRGFSVIVISDLRATMTVMKGAAPRRFTPPLRGTDRPIIIANRLGAERMNPFPTIYDQIPGKIANSRTISGEE